MLKPVSDSDFVLAIDNLAEKLRNFAQLVRTLPIKEGERRTRSHTPAFERGWDDLCIATKPVRKAIHSRANFPHGTTLTSSGMLAGYAREFEAELDGAIAQVVVWGGYTRRDADGADVYDALGRRPNGETVDIAYQSLPADWVERADAALVLLDAHRNRIGVGKHGLRNGLRGKKRRGLSKPEVLAKLQKLRSDGHPYTTDEDLGNRIGCSESQVRLVVKADTAMKAWKKLSKPPKPRAIQRGQEAIEEAASKPMPEVTGDLYDRDKWMAYVRLAKPDERASLAQRSPSERAELIELWESSMRDSDGRFKKDKVYKAV